MKKRKRAKFQRKSLTIAHSFLMKRGDLQKSQNPYRDMVLEKKAKSIKMP